MDDNSFLESFYVKVGDSIALGTKVWGIRGYLTQRDINSAVTAGERMDKNLLASKALAEGDEATIQNIVTAETGVHPINVQQGVTLEQVQMVVDASASKNLEVIKRYIAPPKKRGRKANKP